MIRALIFTLMFLSAPALADGCEVGGCSRQLCVEKGSNVASTCEWSESYACYEKFGTCEKLKSNKCGWRETRKLRECLQKAQNRLRPLDGNPQ